MSSVNLKNFKDILQRSSSTVKSNFLTASEVFFDNAANVLRAVCTAKYESQGIAVPKYNQYGLPEKELDLESIEFTTLVNHVLKNESEPRNLTRQYRFKKNLEFDDKKASVVLVAESEQEASSLPDVDDVVILSYVNNSGESKCVRSCVVKFDGLQYYLDWNKKIKFSVSVYHATPVIAAANSLRVMRNSIVGHSPSTSLSDDALKTMLTKVEKAYIMLMDAVTTIPKDVCLKLMADFKKIKEDSTKKKDMTEEEVNKAFEVMWEKERANIKESLVDALGEKLANVDEDVQVLKQKLFTVEQEVQQMAEERKAEKLEERMDEDPSTVTGTARPTGSVAAPSWPLLIAIEKHDGSTLRIKDSIVDFHDKDQCIQFAHLLLNSRRDVMKIVNDSSKQDKKDLVRAVLDKWLSSGTSSWQQLIHAMTGADMDKATTDEIAACVLE